VRRGECDEVRYIGMFTNQPSWSGPFDLMVTSTGYGAGGPAGLSPAVGTYGVTLSFLLQLFINQSQISPGIVHTKTLNYLLLTQCLLLYNLIQGWAVKTAPGSNRL
jgi:hypothetical protein